MMTPPSRRKKYRTPFRSPMHGIPIPMCVGMGMVRIRAGMLIDMNTRPSLQDGRYRCAPATFFSFRRFLQKTRPTGTIPNAAAPALPCGGTNRRTSVSVSSV